MLKSRDVMPGLAHSQQLACITLHYSRAGLPLGQCARLILAHTCAASRGIYATAELLV